MTKSLILCDCEGSQTLDADAIATATSLTCSRLHTALCTSEIELAAKHIAAGDTIIACAQEADLFTELAEEIEAAAPLCVDIRDRAGWREDTSDVAPKVAALLADAQLQAPAPRTIDVSSEGLVLIVGDAELAMETATRLSETVSPTVLATSGSLDVATRSFDVIKGQLAKASGALGQFEVTINAFQAVKPGGRGAFSFTEPRDGAQSNCDVILDLTGGTPLFPAHEKRDGYLRADPKDRTALEAAIFEASHLIGVFEKTLHIRFDQNLCAHSRAEQPACNRCLNVCPTGAILSAGEHVAIDPNICAGCGSCAAVCPSGAASADDPGVQHLFNRLRAMSEAYRSAGGENPHLLVHDSDGAELISYAARYDRGLPADVIPMEVTALAGFGHAEMLAALAVGFAGVTVLMSRKSDRDVITAQHDLAAALGGENRINLIDPTDPEALCEHLYTTAAPAADVTPILPLGGRREVTRMAAKALTPNEKTLALPEGAPYGAVLVNTDTCTLCLSCASLCPPGALTDNPDRPELRFQEDACLQCGLCVSVCPEDAIALVPQMNLTQDAFAPQILNEEEPFACIECGALFGVKSTIERIIDKLAGKHPMFTHSDNAKLIQMCDNCRVAAQYHAEAAPFQGGMRPKVRTTDDYLKERDEKA